MTATAGTVDALFGNGLSRQKKTAGRRRLHGRDLGYQGRRSFEMIEEGPTSPRNSVEIIALRGHGRPGRAFRAPCRRIPLRRAGRTAR